MVEKITRGIKVVVKSRFKGTIVKTYKLCFEFVSTISIKNNSYDSVQILSHHWEISDALNSIENLEGEGVGNKKPVIKPGQTYTYDTTCFIDSPLGTMRGYLDMINFSSTKLFKVEIPQFKLYAPFALN